MTGSRQHRVSEASEGGDRMTKKFASSFDCAVDFTLHVVGGKWKAVILCYLKMRPCRYAELRRLIPKLSDKVLTERLRDLTAQGLIAKERSVPPSTSHVYVLTHTGRSLGKILTELYNWGEKHAAVFGVELTDSFAGRIAALKRET
jgi:DNA-binding HxlR family transcriptional regulator